VKRGPGEVLSPAAADRTLHTGRPRKRQDFSPRLPNKPTDPWLPKLLRFALRVRCGGLYSVTIAISYYMGNLSRKARRCIQGMPYLRKELARRISIRTGKVLVAPTTYYVIFSGRCNLACPFCTIHTAVEPILPDEVMLRIVRQAAELSGSGFSISLSGGEPMIYPALYPALELAQKLGIDFGFTTNGLALTRANVQRVVAYNPFNINVSIESADAKINEALRPFPNGTKRSLDAVDWLSEEKERTGSRLSLIVKPTIMEQNYRSLPDLVRHFGKHSKVQINFQPYVGPREQPFWVKDLARLAEVFCGIAGAPAGRLFHYRQPADLRGIPGLHEQSSPPGQSQLPGFAGTQTQLRHWPALDVHLSQWRGAFL